MGFQNLGSTPSSNIDLSLYTPPNTAYATTGVWESIKNDLNPYTNIYLTSHSDISSYVLDNITIPKSLKIEGFLNPFQFDSESSTVLDSNITIDEGLELKNLKLNNITINSNINNAWFSLENCTLENLVINENVNVLNITTCRIRGTITNNSNNLITLDYVVVDALPEENAISENSIVVIFNTRTAYILTNGAWAVLGQNALNTQAFSTVSPFRLAVTLLANREINGGILP